MTDQRLVHVDGRGRATLGANVPDGDYLLTRDPDGSIHLQPAVILTRAEAAVLADTDLMRRIEEDRAHPERRVARPERRRSHSA